MGGEIHSVDRANQPGVLDERYTKSLEELCQARTEQLKQTTSQNEQLLELLKQIHSMESLEQVREAVQVCLEKFAPQQSAQAPEFGGEAGEPVPEVDPEDLKAVWLLGKEANADHPGAKAVGVEVMKLACKPGANVEATWYRSSFLWFITQIAQQQLAPWLTVKDGFADPIYRTMASIPIEWLGSGVRQGLPFDMEEFLRRLSEN